LSLFQNFIISLILVGDHVLKYLSDSANRSHISHGRNYFIRSG